MYRTDVFKDVGGFNGAMIAGEEPELCVRIRRAGFVVLRIDAEMTLHDANITRFSQWWKRTIRSGHASAEGMALARLHRRATQGEGNAERAPARRGRCLALALGSLAALGAAPPPARPCS